jgi:hypothetical protein
MLYLSKNKLHSNQKTNNNVTLSVGSVDRVTKFDGYRPNYRHLRPKVDRNGLCSSRFLCHRNGTPEEIMSVCFGTGESGNVSINSFWQVKQERDARWCSTVNTGYNCEKDILTLRLFEDSWRTGASKLQDDVNLVGCCVVTAISCVY